MGDGGGPVANAVVTCHERHSRSRTILQNEKSLANRILGYSFAASVVINLGWIFWVAHSDIFGSAANIAQLHEKPIKIFKPIPVKPKPKPPKPIPPPPPPKQQAAA